MWYGDNSIGEYLLNKGKITPSQLREVMQEQMHSGESIGEILVKRGYVTEEDVVRGVSEQLGIPFIDLRNYTLDPKMLEHLPVELAEKFQAVPVNKIINALTVAMVNPLDIHAVDEIKSVCGLTVRPVFGAPTAIKETIAKYYKRGEKKEGKEEEIAQSTAMTAKDLEGLVKEATEGPAVKIVNSLFNEAVEARASDIHLEPEVDKLYVRFRIDGVLQEMEPISKDLEPAIISRIKIIANMDIAEKRLPQDGRIKTTVAGREIDLRVSTLPTIHGENVVIRILDKEKAILKLEELGFNNELLEKFKAQLRKPFGMILVTGPTGSGKTTTLYAGLNFINDLKKNIITIEDPVEYVIPRVRQVQINPKAGLTFGVGLRSILRHDPDIIMVGEVRDRETAEIAIHSALTGHLVLSTLHTNDAPSSVSRLIDMDIESFLVASALSSVVAQRLVRVLCQQCKQSYFPSDTERHFLNLDNRSTSQSVYKEQGCSFCRSTGFKGRIGIFELLIVDEGLKELILKKAPAHEIKDYAIKRGMHILKDDAVDKVLEGITSVSEALRVCQEV